MKRSFSLLGLLVTLVLIGALNISSIAPAGAVTVSWKSWGGYLTSSPDTTVVYPGVYHAFVRGGDNALYTKQGGPDGPSGSWIKLGGYLTSKPAAANVGGLVHVFVRGGDNGLYHISSNNSGVTWSRFERLAGSLTSGPSAAQAPGLSPSGQMNVYARGEDNGLWYLHWNGSSWSTWQALGGGLTSDPGAAGRYNAGYVFVRGGNNALYMKSSTNGTNWTGWVNLGGALTSGPDATFTPSAAEPQVLVAVLGGNHGVYTRRVNTTSGTVLGWESVGGVGTSDPSTAANLQPGLPVSMMVFVRGTNSGLWAALLP